MRFRVRMIRQAMAPRLAIRTLLNTFVSGPELLRAVLILVSLRAVPHGVAWVERSETRGFTPWNPEQPPILA